MTNDFDVWNDIKKQVDMVTNYHGLFPKEKEVWIVTLGKNIRKEQNGGNMDFSRPVLVVKKFNNEIFWVVPLSTKQKKIDYYHNFVDPIGQSVSVILAQLRLVSIKRFIRDLYEMPESNFEEIQRKLREFLT